MTSATPRPLARRERSGAQKTRGAGLPSENQAGEFLMMACA